MSNSLLTINGIRRHGSLAAGSLLFGLLCIYGFSDLHVGYPNINLIFGGVVLCFSIYFTLSILCTNYAHLPMRFWGSGLALLFAVLPLYLALKSGGFVCHLSTAKWAILTFTFVAAGLVLYGFVLGVETRPGIPAVQMAGETSRATWSAAEVKSLTLMVMLFIALFVLLQQLVQACWW